MKIYVNIDVKLKRNGLNALGLSLYFCNTIVAIMVTIRVTVRLGWLWQK